MWSRGRGHRRRQNTPPQRKRYEKEQIVQDRGKNRRKTEANGSKNQEDTETNEERKEKEPGNKDERSSKLDQVKRGFRTDPDETRGHKQPGSQEERDGTITCRKQKSRLIEDVDAANKKVRR